MTESSNEVKQVKKRRITQKDWDSVSDFVKKELAKREQDSFRKKHERIWTEVDRQVRMEAIDPVKKDPNDKGDWHNSIELGELARASEILTADAMRLEFPNSREWFECHSELPPQLEEQTGQVSADPDRQKQVDGAVRAFMAQQHQDFGLKERINLSIHEALHHGGFVVEVDEETALRIHDGQGIQSLKAPIWKPHSMWNCYPDPSPSVIGTGMFYTGSMIIREFMPLYVLKEMSGEGWMPSQFSKIKKRTNKNKDVETEDVELIKFFGDVVIKRQDGDVILPNSETFLANDTVVYWNTAKLPFPRIIYNGYERMDVRDPYYVSPLIKTAPMHKMASRLANKLLDNIDLHVEPPIVYDGNDPNFVRNGGPVIAPGSKTPTKGMANFKELSVGDPTTALNGLTFALDQIRQSTAVDAARTGAGDNSDKTATEVRNDSARGEVRIVDFVEKLGCSLRTFLYMQHEFNKKGLEKYSFYNPEMDAPDFMWITKDELPLNIHFDVVGAKSVLGEEQRANKMMGVTMMAAQNPLFAPLLDVSTILKEAYMDAGAKHPERLLKQPENPNDAAIQQVQQQAQQAIQQYEQEIFGLQKQLAIRSAVNDAKVQEATMKAQTQGEISQFKAELEGQLSVLKTQLDIINKQPDQQQEHVKAITQAISEIETIVNSQFQNIDQRTSQLESHGQQMDSTLQQLLQHVSRPPQDRMQEILNNPDAVKKIRGMIKQHLDA